MSWLQRAKKEGKKFINPEPTTIGGPGMALKLIPLYLGNKAETVPRVPLGPFYTDSKLYELTSELRVTWFGHSSSLIELDGVRVLIDPVWDDRAAPVQWAGPKRFFAPTLPLDELPRLDAVLLSHDHYDHLGAGTVKKLARARPELRWVTSLGVGGQLAAMGVLKEQITELDWTEQVWIKAPDGASVEITSLPARHFSGRSFTNRFETLWASFVLRGMKHCVYYGADSGLWSGFEEVGQKYGPFDLTMLEVGAFHERWASIHLGPDGAAEAFARMGASGLLMPIHWGLFNLALHGWREPIARILELADARGYKLFSPEPGKPEEVHEMRSDWWR